MLPLAVRVNSAGVIQWTGGNVLASAQAPTLAAKDDLELALTPSGAMSTT